MQLPDLRFPAEERKEKGVLFPGQGQLWPSSKQLIPKTQLYDAIMSGHTESSGSTMFFAPLEDQFRKVVYPIPKEEGGTEIRMIWMDNPCRTTCWNDGFKTVEALRSPKIETLIVQHLWLENDTVLADIILPVNTKLEEEDIMRLSAGGRSVHGAIIENQAIEPVGESLSDFQAWVKWPRSWASTRSTPVRSPSGRR